jgi:hypothetical protein
LTRRHKIVMIGLESTQFQLPLVARALCRTRSHCDDRRRAQLGDSSGPPASGVPLDGLFTEAPAGLCLLDRALRYLRVNPALAALHAIPVTAHLGRTPSQVLPHLGPVIEASCRRVFDQGETVREDLRPAGAGGPRWLGTFYPVRSLHGDTVAVGGLVLDVTAETRARDELRFMSDLVENSGGVLAWADLDGRLQFVNAAGRRLFGAGDDQHLGGLLIGDFLVTEKVEQTLDAIRDVVLTGGTWRGATTLRHLRTGEPIPLDTLVFPVRQHADGAIVGVATASRDARERRQSEAALRAAEAEFRTLCETVPVGVFRCNTLGQLAYANTEALRIFGLTEATCHGVSWTAPLSADARERIRGEWLAQAERGEPYTLQGHIEPGDGRRRHVEARVDPVQDEGRQIGFIGMIQDVTERLRADDEARTVARILVAFVEETDDFVLFVEPDERVRFLNHAGRRLAGLPPDLDVTTTHGMDFFFEDDRARARELLRPATGRASWRGEFRLRHWHAGTPIPVDMSLYEIAHPLTGDPLGIAVVCRDASQRKQREHALSESEERFRQVAESVHAVFWLAEPRTLRRLYVSPAFEEIWGVVPRALYESADGILGTIHPDDRDRVAAVLAADAENGFDVEYRIVRPDAGVAWIRDRAFPVRDIAGRVERLAGIAIDVTEQRRVEAELRQAQKMETVGRLAGGVAHDFNNLLTVILAHVDFLKETPDLADEVREDVREIEFQSRRAVALTRQLLALSRRQALAPRLVDLNALTLQMDKLLRRLIGEDVELVTLLAPALGSVRADPAQLEQVLMNLAVNARDAMPNGGKLTIETADVAVGEAVDLPPEARTAAWVKLSVTDTGHGMNPEVMEHAFEPFYTTKEQGKGTGLGLATSYRIVHQCGGQILARSAPDCGASFSIYLPRAEEAAGGAETGAADPMPRGSERLLVVEDEPSVRSICVRTLRGLGYEVLEAASGTEALDRFAELGESIDLLITDVVMPGLGGHGLADKLRAAQPGLRTLFMTGYSEAPIVGARDDRGVTRVLQKPFTPAALAREIRNLLDDVHD